MTDETPQDTLELAPEVELPDEPRKGFWKKLQKGLFMTHTEILERMSSAAEGKTTLDEETLEYLEEALIGADLGVETSLELVDDLRKDLRPGELADVLKLRAGGPDVDPPPRRPAAPAEG